MKSLTWYDKKTDEFMGEIDLSDVDETTLKALFNLDKNSLLTDCYPLPPQHTKAMQQILGKFGFSQKTMNIS